MAQRTPGDSIFEHNRSTRPWGNVTDPEHHTDDQFRYLVLPYFGDISYDDPMEIDSIYTKPELRLSLIDQDHTVIESSLGVIVEVSEQSIISATTFGYGPESTDPERFGAAAEPYHVMDGDTLLRHSQPEIGNEVIVEPSDPHELEVKALFMKEIEGDDAENRALAETLYLHAERFGLPLVIITEAVDSAGIDDAKNDRSADEEADEEAVYEEGVMLPLPIATDITKVLEFALTSGTMDEDQADAVLEAYNAANAALQTPRVEFNSDNTVSKLCFYDYQEASVDVVSLDHDGRGDRMRLAKRQSAKANANDAESPASNLQVISSVPLAPHEAKTMVEEACRSLGPLEASIVEEWFHDVMPTVARRWTGYTKARSARRRLGSAFLRAASETDTVHNIFFLPDEIERNI